MYGIITGFSVSTKRAVLMLIIMLIGKVIGRTYDLISALSLSSCIILVQEPYLLYDMGFLLSFGSVIGIAVIYPYLIQITEGAEQSKSILHKRKSVLIEKIQLLLQSIKQNLIISISVSIIITPILLNSFYQISPYSILLNLIIVPLLSIIVLLGVLGGFLGCFCIELGIFLAGGVHYILALYDIILRIAETLPGSVWTIGKPEIWQIILYYTGVIVFWFSYRISKRKKTILFLIVLCFIFYQENKEGIEVTILDVGQGDGIIVETENRTTFLIDGGSSSIKKVGIYRIEPFLKTKGISKLNFAIITHVDEDHISGLKELIEGNGKSGRIIIENIILPKTDLEDEAYLEIINLAQKQNIPISYIAAGEVIQEGEFRMLCLHPSITYHAETRNAYSTVLELSYGSFKMLFTGDLEQDGELVLLQQNVVDKYDVLKVAHHGSKYSSTEDFLQQARPTISIISCGENNRYGHPHTELIERLDKINSNYFQTNNNGAITIRSNGNFFEIDTYKNK